MRTPIANQFLRQRPPRGGALCGHHQAATFCRGALQGPLRAHIDVWDGPEDRPLKAHRPSKATAACHRRPGASPPTGANAGSRPSAPTQCHPPPAAAPQRAAARSGRSSRGAQRAACCGRGLAGERRDQGAAGPERGPLPETLGSGHCQGHRPRCCWLRDRPDQSGWRCRQRPGAWPWCRGRSWG